MGTSFSSEQWATGLREAFAGAFQRLHAHDAMPRRRSRGDVRTAILALLAEQPMHGYQLIREIDRRTDGAWRPSPGSVYPTLQLLADEGLVKVAEDGERKSYSLTDAGREAAPGDDTPLPWDAAPADGDASSAATTQLPQACVQLARAFAQVAHDGSNDQVARAVDVAEDARRRLYAILAEG